MTGTGEALFDFIATSVKDFVDKHPPSEKNAQIGFTFSFPVKQTAINSGSLIKVLICSSSHHQVDKRIHLF
jgi:hexokinase